MNLIIDNEWSIVHVDTLVKSTGMNYTAIKKSLQTLVKNGQLFSIEKGLYSVRNFQNPYVIANAILRDSAIAYWSALNLHGLTEQIPNVIYVQSTNRKQDRKVFNVRYKFIQVKPEKICGIMKLGHGNELFKITDVEKTLLDCFDLPQYSGGYEELIRAFALTKVNGVKLLKYGKQMNNLSVLKRMAYLSELYELKNLKSFRDEVQKMVNKRYTLLAPVGENQGAFNSKWKIRVNIQEEMLLGIVHKIY
jgi:predicted transcriptional regulator of viral defense system